MENSNLLFLFIIVGIIAYLMIPNVKLMVDDTYHKFVDKKTNNLAYNLTNNGTNIMPSINYLDYSILGKPQRLQEFNCRYDRDCTIYISACEYNVCTCLSNGECGIKVNTDGEINDSR
jgi:Mn2+/Fe2+ NRAMP family transporter